MAVTDNLVHYKKRHSTVEGKDGLYLDDELDKISASIKILNDTVTTLSTGIPLTSLAGIATATFLGNISGSTASPVALTATQVTANLNVFTTTLKGLVSAPGSVTGAFLRDDGTWAAVSFTGRLLNTNNLSDVSSAATSRTNLGLGSAALLTAGVAANNAVQLDGSAKMPAVDGSALTNITAAGRLVAGTPLVKNPYVQGTVTTQAHGLGVTPTLIDWSLECLTAEGGYSVGDKIRNNLYTGMATVLADATNVVLITQSSVVNVVNKSTFATFSITAANWKLTLTPYTIT